MSPSSDQPVELGVITKPHGVQGAVKLRLHNPGSDVFERGVVLSLALGDDRQQREITAVSSAGGQLVLSLDGITGRDQAEQLRGAGVLIERAALSSPQDGEFFYMDLIGLEVVDERLGPLGTVASVFEAGASDILVVQDGDEERFIPLVDEWVASVDLDQRRILIVGAEQWEPFPR